MYSRTVLKARNLKSRYWQASLPLHVLRGESFLSSSFSWLSAFLRFLGWWSCQSNFCLWPSLCVGCGLVSALWFCIHISSSTSVCVSSVYLRIRVGALRAYLNNPWGPLHLQMLIPFAKTQFPNRATFNVFQSFDITLRGRYSTYYSYVFKERWENVFYFNTLAA